MSKISVSATNNLRRCKRSYYYYKTRPFKRNINLIYGIAFETAFEESLTHGLEVGIEKGLDKFWKQNPEKIHTETLKDKGEFTEEKLQEDINNLLEMLPDMVERLYNKVKELKIDFLTNQATLVMTMKNGNQNQGRFDGIIKYQDKKYIWELKGHSPTSMKKTEDIKTDNQVLNYLLLKRAKGLDAEGVIYCQVKKKIPKEPKILKNGKLSVAKNQGCDKETYLEYARNIYDEIPNEVMDCYEGLSDFVQIDIITPNDIMLDNFEEEMMCLSEEVEYLNSLIKNSPELAFKKCYTNRGKDCSWCNHKEACLKNEM